MIKEKPWTKYCSNIILKALLPCAYIYICVHYLYLCFSKLYFLFPLVEYAFEMLYGQCEGRLITLCHRNLHYVIKYSLSKALYISLSFYIYIYIYIIVYISYFLYLVWCYCNEGVSFTTSLESFSKHDLYLLFVHTIMSLKICSFCNPFYPTLHKIFMLRIW